MFKRFLAALLAFVAMSVFAAVDVNTASQADLDGVKGIGPAIAGRIVDARKAGAFKDWGDFIERVKGVGEHNAAKFSESGLTVNGASYKGAPAKPAATPAAKPAPAAAPAPAPTPAAKPTATPAAAAPAATPTPAAAPAAKTDAKADAKAAKEAAKKEKAEKAEALKKEKAEKAEAKKKEKEARAAAKAASAAAKK